MMDLDRLYRIVDATTTPYRKGNEVAIERMENAAVAVAKVMAMPHVDSLDAGPNTWPVDVHFMLVAVDRMAAGGLYLPLVDVLAKYPDMQRFRQGLSYIELGEKIGDQGMALRLIALGGALELWDVITPATMGVDDADQAEALAGAGYVMFGPLLPKAVAAFAERGNVTCG